MSIGEVRPMRSAWCCAGFRSIEDGNGDEAELYAADDEIPVLSIPAHWDNHRHELAYAWAMCELFHQRFGWLCLVRALMSQERLAATVTREDHAAD